MTASLLVGTQEDGKKVKKSNTQIVVFILHLWCVLWPVLYLTLLYLVYVYSGERELCSNPSMLTIIFQ